MSIDREELLDRVDNDTELLEELIEIFGEDAPENIAAIEGALASGDKEVVERSAHSLKGSSRNMAAEPLAVIACEIENAGRDGNLDGLDDKIIALKEELERTMISLKEMIS